MSSTKNRSAGVEARIQAALKEPDRLLVSIPTRFYERCPIRPNSAEAERIIRALVGHAEPAAVTVPGRSIASGRPMPLHYRNPSVVRRIGKDLAVPEREAEHLFDATLRFLAVTSALIEDRGDYWPRSPPPLIDAAWHAFLLHTEDYAAFCSTQLGKMLHHRPAPIDLDDRSRIKEAINYTLVRQALQDIDGPLEPQVWPPMTIAPGEGVQGIDKPGAGRAVDKKLSSSR